MAQSSACCSPCQNPYNGKDKLDGGTPTEGSNRRTSVSAATDAPTPAVAPIVGLFIAFGTADSFIVRDFKDDIQQILRTVLDSKPPASVLARVVAATPHYEGPRERPLKSCFLDIYQDKTHLEYYNFFQQCKD